MYARFRQRMEAIAEFPDLASPETEPGLSLVDDAEGLEKALTEYLTGFHNMILHLLGLRYEELHVDQNGLKEKLTGVNPARVFHELFA